jgi:hypothetical protein
MRILYDQKIYAVQNAGRINRYFASLISRLPENFTEFYDQSALVALLA